MVLSKIFLGKLSDDMPIFKTSINIDEWTMILQKFKEHSVITSEYSSTSYYRMNDIFILENMVGYRNIYRHVPIRQRVVNNNFLLSEYSEEKLDYILPDFEYNNKQVNNIIVIKYNDTFIYFNRYIENGNYYYQIYSISNNDTEVSKFTQIMGDYLIALCLKDNESPD